MEFLKKHYEKIILSVVLLGLAAVAATLPIQVNKEKGKEEERKQQLLGKTPQPIKPVNLTTNQQVLEKVKSPISFDIAGRHNLFNPVPWIQRPNGELIKIATGKEVGLDKLEVVAIHDLKLIVAFDGVVGQAPDYKYQISVIRETERSPRNSRAFTTNLPNNLGLLKEIRGPAEAPTELVFVLAGENEPIVISKDKPYTQTIGYAADLRYTPGNWMRKNQRKGDEIPVETERYIIFAIDKEAVVLSNKANKSRKTIPLSTSAAATPKK